LIENALICAWNYDEGKVENGINYFCEAHQTPNYNSNSKLVESNCEENKAKGEKSECVSNKRLMNEGLNHSF
jgi:hypothetical protein